MRKTKKTKDTKAADPTWVAVMAAVSSRDLESGLAIIEQELLSAGGDEEIATAALDMIGFLLAIAIQVDSSKIGAGHVR